MNDLANWDAAAHQILRWAGTYWLHSTFLLTVAWLVSWRLRLRNQALVERLWKFAAVAPLLTAPIALSVGFTIPGNDFQWIQQLVNRDGDCEMPNDTALFMDNVVSAGWNVSVSIRAADREPQFAQPPEVPVGSSVLDSRGDLPKKSITNQSFVPQAVDVSRRGTNYRSFAFILALSIALMIAVGCCRLAFNVAALRYELSRCQQAHESQIATLARLTQQFTIRKPIMLLTSSSRAEPIACGWLKWRIVVPVGCADRLTEQEWKALLSHEIAHFARGDTWWLLVGGILCNCLPFQPLNFLAHRRWTAAAEFLSDEWAAVRTADPVSLASCLTRIAEWRIAARSGSFILASPAASSALVPRIERLVGQDWQQQRSSLLRRWWWRFAAAICFAGLAGISPLTADMSPEKDSPADSPPLPATTEEGATRQSSPSTTATRGFPAELLEMEMELARCEALAKLSDDDELKTLVGILSERARLLREMLEQ